MADKKYSEDRPTISAELRRSVMVEAGHACSISRCGEHTYLEIHHINENREDNRIENLILLCDKHHKMAHNKVIDRKALKKYKDLLSGTTIPEKKNSPVTIFQKKFQIGEVGKRVLPYGTDKILVLSELKNPDSSAIMVTVSCYNNDGSKNKNFGTAGKVILDFNRSVNSRPGQILVDQDFNIYIVGHSLFNDQFNVVVCKLLPSSHYDTKFGENGISRVTSGKGGHDYAMSAIFNIDDGIISVGHQYDSQSLFLAKLKSNGQIDTSFNKTGFVCRSFSGNHDWGVDIAVTTPENKILVLFNSGTWEAAIIRFNHDGSVDTDFGTGGVTKLHEQLSSGDLLKATSIALQSDGKILIAGYGNEGIVVRLEKNGSLDINYAQNGKKIIRGQHRTDLQKIIVSEDDRIFVGGSQSDGNSIMNGLVASLDKFGTIIREFGEDGFVYCKGETKQRITDITLINKSTLALVGEQDVMSNGYETSFLGIFNLDDVYKNLNF